MDRETFGKCQVTQNYLDKGLSLRDLFGLAVRASEFQPILIDLMQKIVERKNIVSLLKSYEQDRFSEPSSLPQREIIRLSEIFYKVVPNSYRDVELSPVAPLGTNSIMTNVSQRTVLSTVRNVEVLADPTTLLALECARRKRLEVKGASKDSFLIDLCSSVRCIRGQLFDKDSGFVPHFQLFALASGSLGETAEKWTGKIIEHLSVFLDFLKMSGVMENGYLANDVKVQISNVKIMETIIRLKNLDRKEVGTHSQDNNFNAFSKYGIELPSSTDNPALVDEMILRDYEVKNHVKELIKISERVETLKDKYPGVRFNYDLARIAGIGYYNGPCFKITAFNRRGEMYPLADGGYSNWLAKLLSNRKVGFFSSGFGLELFGKLFKA